MEPLRFTMGSQWIPSDSRAVVMCCFAFPVSFAPCAARTLLDTEPLRFTMSYRWDLRYLACTFTVFPLAFSLVSFIIMSHERFTRLLGYFDIVLCPLFMVQLLVEQQTRDNQKKRILHQEKKNRETKVESVMFLVFPSYNIQLINVSCLFIIWRFVFCKRPALN